MKFHWFGYWSWIGIVSAGLYSQTVSAYEVCMPPDEPSCISSRYAFENEISATRCRRDVDYYLREIESYAACLQAVRDEYLQRANAMQTRLNCRMRGDFRC